MSDRKKVSGQTTEKPMVLPTRCYEDGMTMSDRKRISIQTIGKSLVLHPRYYEDGLIWTGDESPVDSLKTHPFSRLQRYEDSTIWADEKGIRARENEDVYLQGWQLTALISLLMLGQFIMGLDATVITTALPHITADFHSLDDVGWYGSAYLLMVTATQPTWGKIYTHFNVKWTFVIAVIIFELGSIVCATAQTSWMLIFGRIISGVGRSALLAGGTIVVAYQVPLKKRALYFAMLQSMNGVASVVGPPLGGLFTDSSVTWRFCFWINIPIGVLLIGAGLLFFKEPRRSTVALPLRQKLLSLDLFGAIILTVSLVCLFVAFQIGGTKYDWSDRQVWGWLLGFGSGVIVYTVLQHRLGEKASIPTRIISDRNVLLSCLYTGLLQIGFSVHTYFLPFYFQSAKSSTAEQSGLYLVPYLAADVFTALVIGALLMATGALTNSMVFGSVMFSIGSGLMTMLQPESLTGLWVGFQIIAGIGIGSSVQLSLVAMQSSLADDDIGVGNGVWFLSNFAGGSIGVAVAQTIFINVLRHNLDYNLPGHNSADIISAGATAISSAVPEDLISIVQQAYSIAITRSFIFPAVAAALGTMCLFGMRTINLKK